MPSIETTLRQVIVSIAEDGVTPVAIICKNEVKYLNDAGVVTQRAQEAVQHTPDMLGTLFQEATLIANLAAANARITALQGQLDHANAQVAELTQQIESAPVSPPAGSVTPRQARRALLAAGLLGQVNAIIAEAPGPHGDALRVDWEFATYVDPFSPMVAALAQALGLDDAELAALFAAARAITD